METFQDIKRQINRKLAADYPDTTPVVKWQGQLKASVTPTGIPIKWCKALVTGNGYNPRQYTLIVTTKDWSFR